MKNSNGRATTRYGAVMLAALAVGFAPVGTGIPGTSSVVADTTPATSPASVGLGTAANFVILAKSGISTVPQSSVTGNIGVSPIARGGMTGFSETVDGSNTFSTSTQVVGRLYAADYASPSPADLGAAVLDMQAAYSDAAGRAPDYTELGAGNIGGMTLTPGTYRWSTVLSIPTDVTLNGGPDDVFIFQVAGGITQASATNVILTGGARAQNVFWQAAGVVAIGTTAHLEGIVLGATGITLATGASVTGRLFAQTAVTLQMNAVTQPY